MVYVGKDCRQTLFSAQYVKSGFTSGVCGDLLLVVDGFRCKRCDGTIQEAVLTEDLVVDGETYGCVELLLSGRHSGWRWWSGFCCYSYNQK